MTSSYRSVSTEFGIHLGKQRVTGKKKKEKIGVGGSDINETVLIDMINYNFIIIILFSSILK